MNREQYEDLKNMQPNNEVILTTELIGLPEDFSGTIAFGYNNENENVHIYSEYGEINILWYDGIRSFNHYVGDEAILELGLASDFLVPEYTLYEYVKYLIENDLHPRRMTSFREEGEVQKGQYHPKALKRKDMIG